MTVICAVSDGMRCWIGSDVHSQDDELFAYCGPKWIVRNGWAIGAAGQLRTLDLMERDPGLLKGLKVENAGRVVAGRLKTLFDEDGYGTDHDDDVGARSYGQSVLLACRERVWSICGMLSAVVVPGFIAEGSGREIALGAAYALDDPQERVRVALEACEFYSRTCKGQWMMELTDASKNRETAPVHGDVLNAFGAQEGKGQMPAYERGPRIQAKA